MNRNRPYMLIIALLFFGLVACAPEEGIPGMQAQQKKTIERTPKRGGVMRVGLKNPDTFHPLRTKNMDFHWYMPLLYEGLFYIDENQRAQNLLVKAFDVSDDGKIWTFTLREDVFFHHGKKLSTEDVVYSILFVLKPQNQSLYAAPLAHVVTVSVLDAKRFRMVLQEPDGFLPWKLTFPILSIGDLQSGDLRTGDLQSGNLRTGDLRTGDLQSGDLTQRDNGSQMQESFEETATENVHETATDFLPGTGPYQVMHKTENAETLLIRNNRWWRATMAKEVLPPYLDKIILQDIETSVQKIEAFKDEELDLVILNHDELVSFKNRTDIGFLEFPGNEFIFLALQIEGGRIVGDPIIRNAIALAINRREVIYRALGNHATAASFPLPPDSWLMQGSDHLDTNVALAKQLLLEKGFYEKEGFLFAAQNGEEKILELTLLVNGESNAKRQQIALALQEQLKRVGVLLNIQSVENGLYQEMLSARNYEMALVGMKIPSYPTVEPFFSSKRMAYNFSRYQDEKVDNYLERFNKEISQENQKAILNEVRWTVEQENPMIGLFFFNQGIAYRKNLTGKIQPRSWNPIFELSHWFYANMP